jgi:xylan 1,4-beta-xylosidase
VAYCIVTFKLPFLWQLSQAKDLSFMPEALASSANRIFAYRGNVSPPQNWQDWRNMVQTFTDHCVKRYGIGEVSGWKFEVWNEPNIAFWAGSQADYFELYRQSALAINDVDKRLQVGGPSTAQLDWIPDLIQYCANKGVPLDFVSSHIYPSDPQKHVFGRDNLYTFEQVIPRGVEQVKYQLQSSVMPNLPLWITEWSSQNPAFIADTIKNCIGLAEAMSYWTFSNDCEESGVPSGILNNTFGLIDQWGIARPSLHAFLFLHKLGETRLETSDGPILATQRADGSFVVLVWNLIRATGVNGVANGNLIGATDGSGGKEGQDRTFRLQLNGLNGRKAVDISQVSMDVGSAIPAWKKMGSPQYPTKGQITQLRAAAELTPPQRHTLTAQELSTFSIALPPNGVALLEFPK